MDEGTRFCTSCGKEVDSHTVYCPACGSSMGGPSAQPASADAQWKAVENRYAEEKFKLSFILLVAGAIITLISGISSVVGADATVKSLVDSADQLGYVFEDLFFGMTPDDMKNMVIMMGYIAIVCGIFCGIAALMVRMRQNWTMTIIVVIIATVLGFPATLFGGIFGILVCWYLYKYKDAFETKKNAL
jgi:Predicted membrane protein